MAENQSKHVPPEQAAAEADLETRSTLSQGTVLGPSNFGNLSNLCVARAIA